MRALQYSRYGGGVAGLKHVEVKIPDPNPDEVLIKLEAASLNSMDCKIQKGVARPILPRKFPTIPGTDVAGEVVQVGSKVRKFKPGEKVVAFLHHFTNGALAEYSIAKESLTATIPPEVSAAEAAGLALAGLTAYEPLTRGCNITLNRTGLQNNNRTPNILVTAASGGVGHYAVQLAKLANAHVTATCGARNTGLVMGLGADEVVDYKTPEGAALTSPSGKKYDFVIHAADTRVPWSVFEANLSEEGKVIDLTPGPVAMWMYAVKTLTCSKKRLVPLIASPKGEDFEYLLGLVRGKKLRTVVDSKHPLSKAEDSWEKMLSGHASGKIIVEA